MKVATERIGGEAIDVDVDSAGTFRATFKDGDYQAKSLEGLREQLAKAEKAQLNSKPVDVTILNLTRAAGNTARERYETGRGVVHAKLRGRHERERTWLLTDLHGNKFSLAAHFRTPVCKRLGEAEVAIYEKLAADLTAAEKAMRAFEEEFSQEPAELLGLKGGR